MRQGRKHAVWAICFLWAGTLFGQFGNEWVKYNQPYWSVPVWEDGVRSLSVETLVQHGVVAPGSASESLKAFAGGNQQRLWIDDGGDGTLELGDRVWFLGRKNTGRMDAELYDDPSQHLNPHYSLYNDTIRYFFTADNDPALRTAVLNLTDYENYSPLPWAWQTSRVVYADRYHIGERDIYSVSLPLHQSGEGWGAAAYSAGQTFHTDVPTPEAYSGSDAPNARVEAMSAGASITYENPNHHLQLGFGSNFQQVVDTAYFGFLNQLHAFDLPASALGNTTRITHRSVNDLGAASDFQAVSWVEVEYPRSWDAPSEPWFFAINAPGQTYARIDVLGFAGDDPLLFVVRNDLQVRVETAWDGSALRAIVPLTNGRADLLLMDAAQATAVTSLQLVGVDGTFTDFTSGPDSAFVMIAAGPLMGAADNYRFYRQSQGTEVLLVNAEELYAQYGHGIRKHPLAFRRFINHLINAWVHGPTHLFLVGKSIHEMDISGTLGGRQHPEIDQQNLLPTWGWPASDLAITAGLGNAQFEPAVPTGRIAAPNAEAVLQYLDKVIDFEASPPAEWQKRILHFGGGGNANEQSIFRNYLEHYASIAANGQFGPSVHSFYKSTTDPIQLQLGDSITDLISGGCGLMTFFGHASATGFDQNIDSPENYTNAGRYPLLIGNSCYTGNIHLAEASSTSERFTLAPEAGVIGFVAKGDVGIPGYLDEWTERFYAYLFDEGYGSTIGEAMVEAAQDVQGNGTVNLALNTAMTFALHGDPSLQLYAREFPDYALTDTEVFTQPDQLTTEIDSFDVFVPVINLGRKVPGEVGLELIHTLPGGQDTVLIEVLNDLGWRDTARFRLPVDPVLGIGVNQFDMAVDFPVNLVPEEDDVSNNTLSGLEKVITSGDLLPVYPPDFAILPSAPLCLTASTGDPLAESATYRMEWSHDPDYAEAEFQEWTVPGGTIRWEPDTELPTGQTTYWRCARLVPGEAPQWTERSFRVESGTSGFGQFEAGQWIKNTLSSLETTDGSDYNYASNPLELTCSVYGNPSTNFETQATNYQLGLDVIDYAGCAGTPAWHVAVMDAETLEPWLTNYNGLHPDNNFGNLMACSNARGRPEGYFIFRQNNPGELAGMIDLLTNQIPAGNHVLAYTWDRLSYDSWGEQFQPVVDAFSGLGADLLGNTADGIPMIFYAQAENPESAIEVYGNDTEDFIELDVTLIGTLGTGTMTTPPMGTGTGWSTANWSFAPQSSTDSVRVEVVGIQADGTRISAGIQPEFNAEDLELAGLDNVQRLALRAYHSDPENVSVPVIDRWWVTGNHAPDAAIQPQSGLLHPTESVVEGAEVSFMAAVVNASEQDMDSLRIHYWVERNGSPVTDVRSVVRDSLRVEDVLMDTVTFSTAGWDGDYRFRMEVNPLDVDGYPFQPEIQRFNNHLGLAFSVAGDAVNPLLDVSFDGRHILDGEIIDPNPEVLISLRDDNPFLLMDSPKDTARFKLFLVRPDQSTQNLYFTNPKVDFFPAETQANRASIRWNPQFVTDGQYTLIVQAEDRAGNASGADYRVRFEVESEAAVTGVMNYPNPFTSSTRFVFTLTGTEVPEIFTIQIMTVSGKVVREIHQAELGVLRIGPNMTDYAWDGRDMFGDPLATGVYLYRVIAKLNGEDLGHRASGADPHFQKGIGKMFLIRQ